MMVSSNTKTAIQFNNLDLDKINIWAINVSHITQEYAKVIILSIADRTCNPSEYLNV